MNTDLGDRSCLHTISIYLLKAEIFFTWCSGGSLRQALRVQQSLMGETPLALASPFGRRPRCFTTAPLRS
ncbi:hypothetical protein [Nostoc sp. NZL]|uniref:hypothetical protein n=1 Tax=Nostoc sp. NZL TaxID=2650612 RepID=UPI0018C61D60|nr:hypothetical protein [Nostoc sp. NZL]